MPDLNERETCGLCGSEHVRAVVEGRPLCEKHRAEWLSDEAHGSKIERIVEVLDCELDQEPEGEWDEFLRRVAEKVLEIAA